MSDQLIDELREESEQLHKELKEDPDKWEEFEDVSDEFLPPEVSHLVTDFKYGRFDYEDFFRLSSEHREMVRDYLREELDVELTLQKPA